MKHLVRIESSGRNVVLLRPIAILLAGLFVFAAGLSIRFSQAGFLAASDSPARLLQATRLAGGNAEYLLRLAAADRSQAGAALQSAAIADPLQPEIWIRQGLAAEYHGDYASAETLLLTAAARARTFAPRWTLANFYLRRDRESDFYRWASEAIRLRYSEPSPLFYLAWRITPDGDTLVSRLQPDIAARPALLAFLLEVEAKTGLERAAALVLEHPDASQADLLLRSVNRLLDIGDTASAARVWNGMKKAGMLRLGSVDPAKPGIVNPHFDERPSGNGFDWHLGATDELGFNGPPELRIEFTGKQPDGTVVLWQSVPVEPGSHLRLHAAYQTAGLTGQPGMAWLVIDPQTGKALARTLLAASTAGTPQAQSVLDFDSPPDRDRLRVELRYDRAYGSVRAAGSLTLSNVSLERLP